MLKPRLHGSHILQAASLDHIFKESKAGLGLRLMVSDRFDFFPCYCMHSFK